MRKMKTIVFMLVLCLTAASLEACADSDSGQSLSESAAESTMEPTVEPAAETTAESTSESIIDSTVSEELTVGTQMQRGFVNDNVLHTEEYGDIHFSSYIPESYDGTSPYALFVTLPGWEGLYFQGVGANMVEDFGTEAVNYNDEMIVLSPQLSDWGETSAREAIALTEYFLANYRIDPKKVYLHGMSGGGETGSLVMGMRPDLYTAYLMTSSQWDGDLEVLAEARTPVYMAIGEDDSYYGSSSLKEAYEILRELYLEAGLIESQIESLVVLDVKDQEYFSEAGFSDQHAGGQAFAHDETVMGLSLIHI